MDPSKSICSVLVSLLSEPAAETEMSWEGNRTASKKGQVERPGLGRRDDGKAAVGGEY